MKPVKETFVCKSLSIGIPSCLVIRYDALGGSEKLRLQLDLMAAGLKRMSKRR